jgi:hypothetical protein
MKMSEPAIYRPIMMKFCTQTEKNVLNPKNTKPEVCGHFQKRPPPPSWNSMKRCKSAIYRPILMKFGSHTMKNMLSQKTANANR